LFSVQFLSVPIRETRGFPPFIPATPGCVIRVSSSRNSSQKVRLQPNETRRKNAHAKARSRKGKRSEISAEKTLGRDFAIVPPPSEALQQYSTFTFLSLRLRALA